MTKPSDVMPFGATHCAGAWAPTAVSYTTMSIALVFMTITVPGNLLVILAVIFDPNHNLRTPFTLFIVSLATTDLIVGALVEPLSINTHYREARGESIKKYSWLSQFVYFLSCTASLLILAALTVDRYLAITSPVWYRSNVSFTRAGKASLVIWILSIATSCIFFRVGFVPYAFVFANIALFCTFFIFIFSYVRIFLSFKKQIRNLDAMYDSANELSRARQRAMIMEGKLTKTYLIMLLVFLCCYVPSVVMIYLMNLCSSCSCDTIHWLRDWHFVFVTTNSLVNPFLYAYRMPQFRIAIVRMLRCCAIHTHVTPATPHAVPNNAQDAVGGRENDGVVIEKELATDGNIT